jgi:cyclic pyranopterin phosphate synthase
MDENNSFSHLDSEGRATMVDVSAKEVTRRVAGASCKVVMSEATMRRLGDLPKGDAFAAARLAGIQAAKRTGDLIPLAHPLATEQVKVECKWAEDHVLVCSSVVVTAKTGAEMEALVACSTAALTLYDMVKSVERGVVITDLQLDSKSGGRSGDYRRVS